MVFDILKRKFIKFGVVGALGTLTNLAIFFIFVDILKLQAAIISILAFLVAVTQNYILNHKWTFKEITLDNKISLFGWFKFVLTSLLGLLINIVVLTLIIHFFNPPYKVIGQFFGILLGMALNFLGSKFFVFKNKKKEDIQN